METLLLVDSLADKALLLGLASTRVLVAFLLLPIFTTELIPALCRNALYLGFGALALTLQPPGNLAAVAHASWLLLFAKELFVGAAFGFLFGTVLWAFEAAGQIIDAKTAMVSAQISDPLTGQQVSLNAAFLSRLANFVFMFAGGLMLMCGALLESYALWPLMSLPPVALTEVPRLFEGEFGRLMVLALLVSAPALVVMFAVDGVLGLVNRFAPQLNLFAMAASIKTWAASAVMLLMLSSIVQLMVSEIAARPSATLQLLKRLLGG